MPRIKKDDIYEIIKLSRSCKEFVQEGSCGFELGDRVMSYNVCGPLVGCIIGRWTSGTPLAYFPKSDFVGCFGVKGVVSTSNFTKI